MSLDLERIEARMNRLPQTPKACEEWMDHARSEMRLLMHEIRRLREGEGKKEGPGLDGITMCTGCGHNGRYPVGERYLACCPDNRYRPLAEILRNAVADGPKGPQMEVQWVIDLLGLEARNAHGEASEPSQDPLPPSQGNPPKEQDEHDEYCFIAGGGGGMCNCSRRFGPGEGGPTA